MLFNFIMRGAVHISAGSKKHTRTTLDTFANLIRTDTQDAIEPMCKEWVANMVVDGRVH